MLPIHLLFLALSSVSRPTAAAPIQDPLPVPPPPVDSPQGKPVEPNASPTTAQLPELVPGALPANASPDAVALWSKIRASTGSAGAPAPVTSFELRFDGRGWDAQGNNTDFNEGRIRFLSPGFVDSALQKNGRRRIRGPKGDWMLDANGGKFRLSGVEMENDRRELDQIAHLARTFANLIDSRNLRVRALSLMPGAPFPIPAAMKSRADALKWIEVVSPDFALLGSDGKRSQRDVRAWIGVEATNARPSLAVIAEDDKGTLVHETALLVSFDKYKPLDGFQVPYVLVTYAPDFAPSPWTFSSNPRMQLWLADKCTLRATFASKDFEP
ncbi:MAG: hypothetical protein IT454_03480 [Planctomycetes bacterium]|nr:hypothetical protein [Planctomycetota bacterium]